MIIVILIVRFFTNIIHKIKGESKGNAMLKTTLKGTPITLHGRFPTVGDTAHNFEVVKEDLSTLSLSDYKGKSVILNIMPSVDTPTCAIQLKTFNEKIANADNTALIFVSLDLPFAYKRFCITEGIDQAITGSDFRKHTLAKHYGVQITDGPLTGLYARAVFVIDEKGIIRHAELVGDISNEPNYDAALAILNQEAPSKPV